MNIKLKAIGILITPLVIGLGYSSVLKAELDPEIHKLCLEAKDYVGCTKSIKGYKSDEEYKGNKCPSGYAYIGDWTCQKVVCIYHFWMGGRGANNNPILAGKSSWSCPSRLWSIPMQHGSLSLGEAAAIGFDDNCPTKEPTIGWNSSCETAPNNWRELEAARKEALRPKCHIKLHDYNCNYQEYLDANPSRKAWAEANPEMASNERIKLESVD